MDNVEELLKPSEKTVIELLKTEGQLQLCNLLNEAEIVYFESGYDNWDGGIYYVAANMFVDVDLYTKIKDSVIEIEQKLIELYSLSIRHYEHIIISKIQIIPKANMKIDWSLIQGICTKKQLLNDIEYLKNTMINVSTGKTQIQDVNNEYMLKYDTVNNALSKLRIENPNTYSDLWHWYNKWSADFKHYAERRLFINDLYHALIQTLSTDEENSTNDLKVDISDWQRLSRTVYEIKNREMQSVNEEQYQAIGSLWRDAIISLAQAVYDIEKHQNKDGITVSKTDAKRMLENFVNYELPGSSNETIRKYAKSTIDLANELSHKRTANKQDAALCSAASIALINIIGILSGKTN